MEFLHHVSFGISILGVLVIVFGVVGGVVRFLRSEVQSARGTNIEDDRSRIRHVLGYYLLLGLELLIAADIIDTLMKPSAQNLVALGAIVAIRTVISFSLNAELKSEKHAFQVGRVAPCAPQLDKLENGARGATRPASTLARPTREGAGRLL